MVQESERTVRRLRHNLAHDAPQVIQGLRKRFNGLVDYSYLQRSLMRADVGADRLYQSKFKAFYKVRRDDAWCDVFFQIMEQEKMNSDVEFADVLQQVYCDARHDDMQQVEASYCSKLVATVRPDKPVWDKYVRQNLNVKEPYASMKAPRKIERTIQAYSLIEELVGQIVLTRFVQ